MSYIFTEELLKEIHDLIDQAELCDSGKAARDYISSIHSIANGMPEPCGLKLCEVCSALESYCKRGADKESAKANLNNSLYVFDSLFKARIK